MCKICNHVIDFQNDRYNLCRNCNEICHSSCLFRNKCIDCIPEFVSNSKHIEVDIDILPRLHNNRLTDYDYNDLPIFCPFNELNSPIFNLPEPDDLSDTIHAASEILQTCKYYDISSFNETTTANNSSTLICWNIDGMRTNFDKVKILVSKIEPSVHVMAYVICETNTTEFEAQPFNLQGYNKFVLDRMLLANDKLKNRGSGIIIYLDENISNAEIDADLTLNSYDSEFLVIKYRSSNKTHFIIGTYRSPSGNIPTFYDNLDSLLSTINKVSNSDVQILGDLNCNLYNPASNNVNGYLDCIFSNNTFPLISRATHFRGINPTCIDHILTNNLTDVLLSGIITTNITHHMPVFITLNRSPAKPRSSFIPRPIINEYTLMGFQQDLDILLVDLNTSLDNLSMTGSVIFTDFITKFKSIYDKWFIQTKNNHKHRKNFVRKNWITVGLAKSCSTKDGLYNTWVDNRTNSNWVKILEYKRIVDKYTAKAKFEYYRDEFQSCKTDLKKTWKTINTILGRKKRNRILVFNEPDASHNFNTYFTSIATNLVRKNCPNATSNYRNYLGAQNENILLDNEFSCSDLIYFIMKLNNNKSTFFSPRILKHFSESIAPTLTDIFNLCYNEGTFPNELKIAKVIPIYKNKGAAKEISNYRPISLLSIFSKLFEKLIHKKLMNFLTENDIINSAQYGFRPCHSTQHAIINATENIYRSLDDKLFTAGKIINFFACSGQNSLFFCLQRAE